jgi:hypothetical protein
MDFANRGNRPTQAPQQSAVPSNEQPSQAFQPVTNDKKSKKKLGFGKIASMFMLIVGSLLVLSVLAGLVFVKDTNKQEEDLIQTDKFQAVFLDSQDGQVYFGKLSVYNDDLYQLNDIYYVRVENPIQPEGADQAAQQQANISLAKLGNELHGPQDVMYISRSEVLYWENLKDEGQVVTAIKEFKANGEQTPTNNQNQNQNQSTPSNSNNSGTDDDTDTQTP